jgi:glycerol-3-phosphate dehydrogenase (NAD(P)+)
MHDVAREALPDAPVAVLSGPHFRARGRRRPACRGHLSRRGRLAWRAARDRIARPFPALPVGRRRSAPKSAGRSRTCSPSPAASSRAAGLGQNARAALISRGFAEMTRFGLRKGRASGNPRGLSGLGDLVLTCSSVTARATSASARGSAKAHARRNSSPIAVPSPKAPSPPPCSSEPAEALGVDMPIVDAVCALLSEQAGVDEVVGRLLSPPVAGGRGLLFPSLAGR